MSISDEFQKTIDREYNKQLRDTQFARALSTIDFLKRQGILGPTKYTLPLTDTIGRNISQNSESRAEREPSM